MTKFEEILNIYFGTTGNKLDYFIQEFKDSNNTTEEMFSELKYLMDWLNDEL